MIIGIRLDTENKRTDIVKHANYSYFTMVAKDENGISVNVPGLILTNTQEIKRFNNCIKMIALKKERSAHEIKYNHTSKEALQTLKNYNV